MPQSRRPQLELSKLFKECYVEQRHVPTFRILLGGVWKESSARRTMDVSSPIDGTVIARVQAGAARDAEDAVRTAYDSRRKIRDVPAIDRIDMLNRARHILDAHKEDFV